MGEWSGDKAERAGTCRLLAGREGRRPRGPPLHSSAVRTWVVRQRGRERRSRRPKEGPIQTLLTAGGGGRRRAVVLFRGGRWRRGPRGHTVAVRLHGAWSSPRWAAGGGLECGPGCVASGHLRSGPPPHEARRPRDRRRRARRPRAQGRSASTPPRRAAAQPVDPGAACGGGAAPRESESGPWGPPVGVLRPGPAPPSVSGGEGGCRLVPASGGS